MSESRLITSGTIERLSMMNLLIPEVERIGADALAQRSQGLEVSEKSDGSLVTNVDLAVERALREVIGELDPDGAIVGEEEGWLDRAPCEAAWVIDPIDGTRMFVENRVGCSISVGFWSPDGAVAGIVYDMARSVTYASDAISNSWLCPSTKPVLGTEIHGIWGLEREARFELERRILSDLVVGHEPDGCVLEMAAVAHGQKAGYVFAAAGWAPFPWDLAAGAALLKSVGGTLLWTDSPQGIISLQSEPLTTLEHYAACGASDSATLIALGTQLTQELFTEPGQLDFPSE